MLFDSVMLYRAGVLLYKDTVLKKQRLSLSTSRVHAHNECFLRKSRVLKAATTPLFTCGVPVARNCRMEPALCRRDGPTESNVYPTRNIRKGRTTNVGIDHMIMNFKHEPKNFISFEQNFAPSRDPDGPLLGTVDQGRDLQDSLQFPQ